MNDLEIPEFKLNLKISSADLYKTKQWLLELRTVADRVPAPRPFLFVTPYGAGCREKLSALLDKQGISILQRIHIPDWPRASIAVYAKTLSEEKLRVSLGYEALWNAVSDIKDGERWDLAAPEDHLRLVAARSSLRAQLGMLHYRVQFPGVRLYSPGQVVRLQAFHVPDSEYVEEESRLLDAYLLEINSA
jgi:hypothetical protein